MTKQRIKVENAFGFLKGKFKRFNTRVMNERAHINIEIVKGACYIQNFVSDNDEQ